MSWYTIQGIAENTYRISEAFGAIRPRVGLTTVNLYLVLGQERAALIDTGLGIGDLRAEIQALTFLPCLVLNTHYHWDHIGGNGLFEERAIHESEVDLLAQELDVTLIRQVMQSAATCELLPASFDPTTYRIIPKPATRILHDGDRIDLGDRTLRVLHIPGRSPGHVAYLDAAQGLLFTGDTAYRGPIYACFEGSDPLAFAESVKRLAALPGVAAICPGHDDVITEAGWLGELARCAEAAVSGRVPGHLRDDFIVGREVSFDALTIWLPP